MNGMACNVYVRYFGPKGITVKFISSHGSGHEAEQKMLRLVRHPRFPTAKAEVFALWQKASRR